MWMRSVGLGAMAAALLALDSGCKPSSSNDSAPTPAPKPQAVSEAPGFETVARFHWLGKKQLAADTNATHFLSIWNLPEAARLENQTLDKLATALASGLPGTNPPAAAPAHPVTPVPKALPSPPPTVAPLSPAAALLRPLLADVVQEESYFEIGAAANQPGELLLAVRLTPERAQFWETNLSSALDLITGSPRSGTNSVRAWTLPAAHRSPASGTNTVAAGQPGGTKSLRLERAGDWTVLDLTRGTNAFLTHVLGRIQKDGVPFAKPATNYWVDTTFDLTGISRLLSLNLSLPPNWPAVTMTFNGEGENVRTRGELHFAKPLQPPVAAWNFPTNLIHDPLIGLTAARGVSECLKSLPVWKQLKLSSAPDQIFAWAQGGMPVLEYVAGYWPQAKEVVHQLSETLPSLVNPLLKTNAMGYLTNSTDFNGLAWKGAPFITPELRTAGEENDQFVLAGLVPVLKTNQPPPPELLHELFVDPNRILYSWELTGPRIEQVLYTTQLFRLVSKTAQLPPDSASMQFLKAVAPKLVNCISVATLNGPGDIGFMRKSTIGLDSSELGLVTDWLESPTFPEGLHTFEAPTPVSKPALAR